MAPDTLLASVPRSPLLIGDARPDGFVVPSREVAKDRFLDDKTAAERVGEFGSVLNPDVDVEPSFLELVLDPIHDLAANTGVLLSTHDFL